MLRFIREVWASLSSDEARRTYQDGVFTLTTILMALWNPHKNWMCIGRRQRISAPAS
jgi:hypothetical protein